VTVVSTGGSLTGSDVTSDEIHRLRRAEEMSGNWEAMLTGRKD